MDKRTFLKKIALASATMVTSDLTATAKFLSSFEEQETMMPALFMGHGSPMNAIEDNAFTKGWRDMVKDIPKPKAIVCVSAHWETRGTKVTAMAQPRMIYDMGGFPDELYRVVYNAPGNPELAKKIIEETSSYTIEEDHHWGYDHGTWSVLKHMYPNADIPLIQLSLDRKLNMQEHYDLGKAMQHFRKKGVLFVGSGNIVHNLPLIFKTNNMPAQWGIDFDEAIKANMLSYNHADIINYQRHGQAAEISVNSAEHYIPLLYILGMQKDDEKVSFGNENQHDTLMGIGMRCVRVG